MNLSKMMSVCLMLIMFCASGKTFAEDHEIHTHNVSFQVEGLDSEVKADRLKQILEDTEGVRDSNADHEENEARAEYDPDEISEDDIKETMERLGLDVKKIDEDEAKSCSPGCTKDCCA